MTDPKVQAWINSNIPSQAGKTMLITGANSGLGLVTAHVMAAKGAHVVMACRNPDKAEQAANSIQQTVSDANLDIVQLDVSSLKSVAQAAKACRSRFPVIDVLVNNAGVMGCPTRTATEDGFEMQFGTNHLGAYALTAQLLPTLQAADAGRIVAVGSIAHRNTPGMNLDDPNFERSKYKPFDAYAKSKLANLLFTLELNRRLREANSSVKAVTAHPGYAATNIGTAANPNQSRIKDFAFDLGNRIALPADKGALSIHLAITSDEMQGGEFIGPQGPMGFWGWPGKTTPKATGSDADTARKLWGISEALTGVHWPI